MSLFLLGAWLSLQLCFAGSRLVSEQLWNIQLFSFHFLKLTKILLKFIMSSIKKSPCSHNRQRHKLNLGWRPQICVGYLLLIFLSELGTRQFCRDNVTMLSGHKVVCNWHFTIFIVATPSGHGGLTIFRFSGPWLVLEALLRCRVFIVAKLKCFRVPSSAIYIYSLVEDFMRKQKAPRYVILGLSFKSEISIGF